MLMGREQTEVQGWGAHPFNHPGNISQHVPSNPRETGDMGLGMTGSPPAPVVWGCSRPRQAPKVENGPTEGGVSPSPILGPTIYMQPLKDPVPRSPPGLTSTKRRINFPMTHETIPSGVATLPWRESHSPYLDTTGAAPQEGGGGGH